MKRILVAILCQLLLLSGLTLCACAEERTTYMCGDCEYALLEDGTAELLCYYGKSRRLKIPDRLNGNTVTAVGDEAFADCAELIQVTIPESVAVIGYRAFDNGSVVTLVPEGERDFVDMMLRCQTCGRNFVFSSEKQEFYAERGFKNEPKKCEDCRNAQRNQNTTGKPRTFYSAYCSLCGKEIQLPFEPKNDRPVYCDECYNKLRG